MAAKSRKDHKNMMSPARKTDQRAAGGSAAPPIVERAPQQQRSAQTRERILQSVTDLLEADAYSSATVQDIVSAAGCSVGAFYGRFKDKDAALFAIYDNRCARLEENATKLLTAPRGGLDHKIRKFIDLVIEHTIRHRPVMRAGLVAPAANNIAPFTQRVQEMNVILIKLMSDLLCAQKDQITHQQPDRAALYVVAIIGGLARDGIAAATKIAKSNDSKGAFVKEVERMVHGYLGTKR